MSNQSIIAESNHQSRLLVVTGKYKEFTNTSATIDAIGAEIVTIAIRPTTGLIG